MNTLKDKSISVVVTSPPYNIGKSYTAYKDSIDKNEYELWFENVLREIYRVLDDDGSLFLNFGATSKDPTFALRMGCLASEIFTLQNTIAWIKAITIGDDEKMSFGHFRPVNSHRFINNTFEFIYHLTKSGNVSLNRLAVGVPYKWKCNRTNRKNGQKNSKPDKRCRGNTWFVPYETVQKNEERFNHPAVFPVKLVEMCLSLHGVDNINLVYDPFLGTGTTLVACKNFNIEGVGTDIDKTYCDYSSKRLIRRRKNEKNKKR